MALLVKIFVIGGKVFIIVVKVFSVVCILSIIVCEVLLSLLVKNFIIIGCFYPFTVCLIKKSFLTCGFIFRMYPQNFIALLQVFFSVKQ